MAIDKAVDSTQLNSDLTSVANAIRTKGGTSAQLAFPAGFVSAVQAIPTGTTPTGTKQIAITQNGTVTEDVAAYANAEITVNVSGGSDTLKIRAGGAGNFEALEFPGFKTVSIEHHTWNRRMSVGMLGSFPDAEKISVWYTGGHYPTDGADAFRNYANGGTNNTLKEIEILCDLSHMTGAARFVRSNLTYSDVAITGTPLDFSGLTVWQSTLGMIGLKEVRFAPSSLKMSSISIDNAHTAAFSDDTWVSFANALYSATAGTFGIGATAQATIAAIMGTVSDGVFTKDASGSVSLSDFITTTKGWTLA